jgi:hypothetical protein
MIDNTQSPAPPPPPPPPSKNENDKIVNQLVIDAKSYFKNNHLDYVITETGSATTALTGAVAAAAAAAAACNVYNNDADGMIRVYHIDINCSITSVRDLMSLCDTYQIAENIRYNVDMVALNKIYPYLKELDNMIGMQSIKTSVVDQIMYFIQNLHVVPIQNQLRSQSARAKTEKTTIPICTSMQATQAIPASSSIHSNPFYMFSGNATQTPPASGPIPLPSIASIFANMPAPKLNAKPACQPGSKSNIGRVTGDFMHTVLCGPPGTGKTEVAKILGNIFSHLGILKAGTFKKVTRSDLIAGYLGQTAIKTREIINSAIGGVLFIDEAYALGNTEKRDSFSKECIDTLCEALSDHKHDIMVIIAGYEKELNDCFFSYNEGLTSRFTWRYNIDSYSAQDLRKIFEKIVCDNNWTFLECDSVKDEWFKTNYDYFKYFGRDIEVFFTKTKIAHSRRIFGRLRDNEPKYCLTMKDLENGFSLFMQNSDVKMRGNKFDGGASTLYL